MGRPSEDDSFQVLSEAFEFFYFHGIFHLLCLQEFLSEMGDYAQKKLLHGKQEIPFLFSCFLLTGSFHFSSIFTIL